MTPATKRTSLFVMHTADAQERVVSHAPDRATGLVFDLRTLRVPGALMLLLATVLPRIPGHPGLVCPLRAITGIPCPACGMTTSVEATVRLDLEAAWSANPMGIVAVATALVALVAWFPLRLRVPLPAVFAVLAGMWLFQLFRFGIV